MTCALRHQRSFLNRIKSQITSIICLFCDSVPVVACALLFVTMSPEEEEKQEEAVDDVENHDNDHGQQGEKDHFESVEIGDKNGNDDNDDNNDDGEDDKRIHMKVDADAPWKDRIW